jgi:hypothetical protein
MISMDCRSSQKKCSSDIRMSTAPLLSANHSSSTTTCGCGFHLPVCFDCAQTSILLPSTATASTTGLPPADDVAKNGSSHQLYWSRGTLSGSIVTVTCRPDMELEGVGPGVCHAEPVHGAADDQALPKPRRKWLPCRLGVRISVQRLHAQRAGEKVWNRR